MLNPHLHGLALQIPDMYSGQMRDALLYSAIGTVIAILFIATGIACVVIYAMRKRSEDAALLWFGVFLILYGARNADFLRVVSFLAHVGNPSFWSYFSAVIHHFLVFPFLFFLREIFSNWRRVLRWVLWAEAAVTAVNLVADVMLHRPNAFYGFNTTLAVLTFLAFVVAVFTLSQKTLSTRGLRIGVIVFSIFMVAAKLNGTHFLSLPFNPEPIGVAILVLTLGTLITSRTIENQQRLIALDHELAIARQIQASILPSELPHTSRLHVAARYLPMAAVAGDFYDVLIHDEGRLGIIIADVSGHGVPAALIAAMVKVAAAAQQPHSADPAMVLAGINQTLCGKLTAQFVTAAYLFLDLDQHILRYAAAGHPALICRQGINDSIVSVEQNGLPLGLISVATYSFTERPLTAGSRFLLYTDALIEAADPAGEFFGAERVEQALANSSHLDSEEVADDLLERLKQWVGAKAFAQQQDDLTLLVVDVL